MIPGLGALGGGGLSASSSASTGPFQGGDVGGAQFNFGGINTGTQSNIPGWVWAAGAAAIVIGGFIFLRRR
jgi:hypothetical protein